MPFRSLLLLLAVAALAAGCQTTQPRDPEPTGAALRADVMVDGTSILGAWHAVEVVGNATATRDLAEGVMEQTLIVRSNGRATLTGVDHRAGGDPVAFSGRVTGNRIQFAEMEGAGTLIMSGRRLLLRDPNGRSTVFVRGE